MDIAFTGKGLLKFRPSLGFTALNKEGSLSCHTCCDTGPRFLRSHAKDRLDSHGVAWDTEDLTSCMNNKIVQSELTYLKWYNISKISGQSCRHFWTRIITVILRN